ncbi:MAG TPA: NAD(P)H-hydrate dehydratase [Phycisphaerae bacterium]|nr:NAD(P)H-hydrate dehydratase [Phycisphaerae bacterium]
MSSHKTTRLAIKHVKTIPSLPSRAADAHKGTFGMVLVVGGSVGMAGAPALVGLSALRSGVGLTTIAAPAPVQPTVAGLCACAITLPLPANAAGRINPQQSLRLLRQRGWLARESRPSALVVGPGIGLNGDRYGRQLWRLINAFRNDARVPAIIDADALNLARKSTRKSPNAWNQQPHFRTVITPHPGEMARLHGVTTKDVQADRIGWAVRTAHMMAGNRFDPDHTPVVVLKGAGTVITDGHRVYVNRTGNPGMATGGSGDVLAGTIGALIAQGMTVFDAAVLGVHVHGLAGDRAAEVIGQIAMIATDIINCLPVAFEEVVAKGRQSRK